ncbi:MAG TPA: CBS domain-containing protein [Bacteroidales bacterium]|jgi:acetoin utilization protein AcuB|nr:CBS domain-containing protein [Bacteroidales bacterium]
MLAKEMISDVVPAVKTSDTGQTALNWMEIFRVSHLPIVNEHDYLGLISDSDIYDLNQPEEAIGNHSLSLPRPYVTINKHIYEVLALAARHKLTVVPVLDEENHFRGVITYNEIISGIASFSSVEQPGGLIVLKVLSHDYSMSRISQIVESNDARILSMYITSNPESTSLEITLKVNTTDLTSIIKTFERYSYEVTTWVTDNDELDRFYTDRYNLLMKYLNM